MKCILILAMCLTLSNVVAQETYDTDNMVSTDPFFSIGFSINDYGLGFTIEKPLIEQLAFYGNVGLGSWGYKLGAGIMFYPSKTSYGSAFSAGICHATGIKELKMELENKYGSKEKMTLELLSVNTINLIYHYNLKVGQRNKLVLSTGYAIALSSDNYKIKGNNELSDDAKLVMEILEPGGLILGIKFAW